MKSSILAVGLFLLSFQTFSKYLEGKHYQVLETKATDTPQLVEFFSYFGQNDNRLENLTAQLDPLISARKNHLSFLGNELGGPLTMAYAIAKLYKLEEKIGP